MNYSKIGPGVLGVVSDFKAGGRAEARRSRRTVGVAAEHPFRVPRVVVFIHCDDTATFDDLGRSGIVVNQTAGRIRTAIVPSASRATGRS